MAETGDTVGGRSSHAGDVGRRRAAPGVRPRVVPVTGAGAGRTARRCIAHTGLPARHEDNSITVTQYG